MVKTCEALGYISQVRHAYFLPLLQKDDIAITEGIPQLDMLKVKCRGNTPEDLMRFMDNAVMDLQMNFLDVKKKHEGDTGAEA